MKFFKSKKVLSLICAVALIFGSTFNNVVSAAEETDPVTPTTETEAPTDAPVKPETEAPEEEQQQNVVTFEFYLQGDGGSESLYLTLPQDAVIGEVITFFVDTETVDVISVNGGDFAFNAANNTLVGTASKDLTVKIVVKQLKPFAIQASIKFVDEEGNPVIGSSPTKIFGEPGSVANYTAPKIAGYKYVGPAEITLPDADGGTVELEYERLPLTLTYKAVDESGNALLEDDYVIDGKIGDAGVLSIPTIPGYKYIGEGTPSTKPGYDSDIPFEFGSTSEVITLVCAETGEEKTGNVVDPKVENKKEVTEEKVLPKTGIATGLTALAGTGLIAAGSFISLSKRKNK